MKIRQAINNLESDPKYKALDTDKKLSVRSHLFDKFVAPYYKNKGVIVNDESKERWVKAGTGTVLSTETTAGKPSVAERLLDMQTAFVASEGKAGTIAARSVIDLHSQLMHGFVKHMLPNEYKEAGHGRLLKNYDRYSGMARDYFDNKEDKLNTWLGSGYAKNIGTSVAEIPGKGLAAVYKHPGYILAGEFTAGLGALGKGEALTEELLNLGPKAKFAYNAIKGAADGYLGARLEGDSHSEALGMAKFGAGAELGFAGATKFLSKLLAWAGPQYVEKSVEAVMTAGKEKIESASSDKISNLTVKATSKALDDVAKGLGYNDFWDAHAKKEANKVLQSFGEVLAQASKETAIHNPELVAAQADGDIRELQSHPLGNSVLGLLKQHGSDPIKDIVEHVTEVAKVKSGSVTTKAIINKEIAQKLPMLVEGLGPGASSIKQREVVKSISDIVKSTVGLQSEAQRITMAWGMREVLPKEAEKALSQEMREIYGRDIKTWHDAVRNLDRHIDTLHLTGHVAPNDLRGVFRSTKLTGEPTKWQSQLDDELKAIQGGHAGGGVSSVEELNRPGKHLVISKSGEITYHGKSYSPESTRPGSVHVTISDDLKNMKVNEGELNKAQIQALRKWAREMHK